MSKSDELEKELIGICLTKPQRIDELVLLPEHFQNKENQVAMKYLIRQWSEHKSISITAMFENYQIEIGKEIDPQKIIAVLMGSMDLGIDSNFEYLQETIFKSYQKKQLLTKISLFFNKKITYDELIEFMKQLSNKALFTKNQKLTGKEICELIMLEKKKIELPYKTLSYFANIQEHDFVILAARPGIGKTGLALNLAEHLSKSYKTLYFSMEMSEKQIYSRLLSIKSGIDLKELSHPRTDYQKESIEKYANELADQKLDIITTNQTVASIKNKIINEAKNGHTIVFIDYVGLVYSAKKYNSIYERITDIVKELRVISLDHDCTIFLISQLNRQSDKQPKLSDLKDSGELEQAGTTVLLLSKESENQETGKAAMNVEIAKNRNGRTGNIPFIYEKNTQRFFERKEKK